jgi:hypothetical protein
VEVRERAPAVCILERSIYEGTELAVLEPNGRPNAMSPQSHLEAGTSGIDGRKKSPHAAGSLA